MKRIFTGIGTIILSILLAAGLFGCGQKPDEGSSEVEPTKKGEPAVTVDFETIELTETGTMAFSTVYSCERKENGVHVEYYIFQNGWDDVNGVAVDEKRMIHSFDGDESVYQAIAELLGSVSISSWDGFSKTNSLVEDGEMFSLEAKLGDGTKVSANGTNSFPKGYRDFVNRLDAICSTEMVQDTSFETTDYSFKVPESWVGNVYAVYRDGMVGFEVKTKKKDRMILCFYQDSYESARGLSDYVSLVSYLKNDQTWFVKMRKMADAETAQDEMNSTQREICKSLDKDMKTIRSSFKLKGDYEIVADPEVTGDGDQSYISGVYVDPNKQYTNPQGGDTGTNTEDTEGAGEDAGGGNEGGGGNGGEEAGGGNEGGGEETGGNEGGGEETGGNEGGGEDAGSADE